MVESRKDFTRLRKATLQEQKSEISKRKQSNPLFSPEEKSLGVYLEELEPQVRDAVLVFNTKGYSTFSSGFYDMDSRIQTIEGVFRLSERVIADLQTEKVDILEGTGEDFGLPEHSSKAKSHITIIQFKPSRPDLPAIKKQWDHIASLLPDNTM